MHDSDERYDHEISLPFLKTLIITDSSHSEHSPGGHSILEAITAATLEIFEDNIQFFDLSLSAFLRRSPHIWKISLPCFEIDKSLMKMIEFLRCCTSVTALSLTPHGLSTFNADRFLRAFVDEGNEGVICPRLQEFTLSGDFDFSLQTFGIFLEGKHGDISLPDVLPWRKVFIDITCIESDNTRKKLLELASEKRAAGLPVRVYSVI